MRGARSISVIVSSLTVVALALAACASDGRTLRPPPATAVTTTTSIAANVAAQPQVGSQNVPLVLSSSAFAADGAIPAQHSCQGAGTSPPLAWTGVPSDAAALALTVVDPDAGGFVHWAITGIPAAVRSIGEGAVPEGSTEGTNGTGGHGWTPPCPPPGGAHHYVFTLSVLQPTCVPEPTVEDIARCTAASTTLVGTYQRS